MDTGIQSVVIVGAGQAGGRAALVLREAGYQGRLVLVGDEPHLPYERPPLSKARLLEPERPTPAMFSDEDAQRLEIQLRLSFGAVAIDRPGKTILCADGERLAYDRLLLATGCRPRQLALPGYPLENIHYLRTREDADALHAALNPGASLAVVGGGFIGLEVAASAIKRGCTVVVIEAADRLLPRLGSPEISQFALEIHRAQGLDIRLGAKIAGARPGALILADGSEVAADLVLAGIGATPNTELAEAAGLVVDDGIVTDENGRTSDPDVFAAGDVTRHFNPTLARGVRLESWQNANLQAKAAAYSLLGEPLVHNEMPWVWSDQGELSLQIVGHPAKVDTTIVRQAPGEGCSVFQFSEGALVGGLTANRSAEMPLIRRMLAETAVIRDPAFLTDTSTPLRRLLAGKEKA